MIQYSDIDNAWVSTLNVNSLGVPTTTLDKDRWFCLCSRCKDAFHQKKGWNFPKAEEHWEICQRWFLDQHPETLRTTQRLKEST